jgi:hypothetical protein
VITSALKRCHEKASKKKKVILRFNAAKYKVEYKTDKNVFHLI